MATQGTAVDRAAELFTSIAAQGEVVPVWQIAALADEHELSGDALVDALAFLEASGLIAIVSVIEVQRRPAPGCPR